MASFVGREDELQLLQEAFERARGGSGSFVLIHGELGIGKSRLMAELACRTPRSAHSTSGRWYESSEVPADTGFREALLPLVSSVGDALDVNDPYVRQLGCLGPQFAATVGVEWNALPVSAPEERYRLWRGVVALLDLAAKRGPVLLALDDLQWCNEASLELLVFLAGELQRLPVLVVGAYRDEDPADTHSLHVALLQIARSDGFQKILLRGLSRQEVGSLIGELWHESPPGPCVDGLFDHTRGNPLFVQELTRHAIERLPSPALWNEAWDEAELPSTLQALVTERLLGLSPECRQLLSIAAAVGHDCDVSLLQQIASVTIDELSLRTEEAVRAGVLREWATGVLSFAHPLMRSAIYQALSTVDRLDLHLRIAQGLEAHHSDAELYAREIAKHLMAAGSRAQPAATVGYCLTAARQARASFAFDEGRRFLQAGLQALRELPGDRTRKAAFLTELGYAEMALGRPDDALRVYRDALAIHEDLGDEAGATDVRRWMAATLMHYGRWQEARQVTTAGVTRAEERSSDAYLGLIGNHALALLLTGGVGEMEVWVEKQLRLAFNRETCAGAHHSAAGWHAWGFGDPAEANEHFLEARRLFLEEGLQATAAQVALDHAFASYVLGDLRQSHEALAEAERLGTVAARDAVLADVHACRSMMHAHRGEWREAEAERTLWRELLEQIGGSTNYRHFARSGHALEIWGKRGPVEAAEVLDPEFLLSPALLARLKVDASPETGRAALEPLRKAIPANGRGLFWLAVTLPLVGSLAVVEPEAGQAYYEALSRYRGGLFDWDLADIALGQIAVSAGRWDDAERHFAEARQFCEQHGLRPFLAEALCTHGVAILRRGGQRREGLRLLDDAKTILEDLGLNYSLSCLRVIYQTPRRGRPPADGPAGLSPRELTVLALIAKGKSNREIATEIVVAERTVEHHVERIFAKLGVSNRAAAAAWALNRGIS